MSASRARAVAATGTGRANWSPPFGPLTLSVPRARLADEAGEREWNSTLLPAYKRLSHRAEALIAEVYLVNAD